MSALAPATPELGECVKGPMKLARIAAAVRTVLAVDVRWKSRSRQVVLAKHVACYIARKQTGNSLSEIALYLCGSIDHSSVVYAVRSIERRRRLEPEVEAAIVKVTAQIETRMPPKLAPESVAAVVVRNGQMIGVTPEFIEALAEAVAYKLSEKAKGAA